jgi:hypothetical protein
MEYCKPITTPMKTSCKLSKDDDSKSIDQRQYKSMIGSLLYVTTSSWKYGMISRNTKGITCISSEDDL